MWRWGVRGWGRKVAPCEVGKMALGKLVVWRGRVVAGGWCEGVIGQEEERWW